MCTAYVLTHKAVILPHSFHCAAAKKIKKIHAMFSRTRRREFLIAVHRKLNSKCSG